MTRVCRPLASAFFVGLLFSAPTFAEVVSDDPFRACYRAAAHVEAEWHLPSGLLAAIGTVESGRGGLGSTLPVAWPWSINVEGHGALLHDKASAVAITRALWSTGRRTIDVGCFQVDLFYHPEAFTTLELAFDPVANARAAAQILTRAWLRLGSWEAAIALYHSASPLRGARYLRQVQTVWPWIMTRNGFAMNEVASGDAVFLLNGAQSVQAINSGRPSELMAGVLPRVIEPRASSAALQWTAVPLQDLPLVLAPVSGDKSNPLVPAGAGKDKHPGATAHQPDRIARRSTRG